MVQDGHDRLFAVFRNDSDFHFALLNEEDRVSDIALSEYRLLCTICFICTSASDFGEKVFRFERRVLQSPGRHLVQPLSMCLNCFSHR